MEESKMGTGANSRIEKLDKEIEEIEEIVTGTKKEDVKTKEDKDKSKEVEGTGEEANVVTDEEKEEKPEYFKVTDEANDDEDNEEEEGAEEASPKKRVSWKQRYATTKAALDATIYGLRQEVASLKERLATFATAYDDLQTEYNKLVDSQRAEIDLTEGLSEEERKYFGEEGVSVLSKIAKKVNESEVTPLKQELEEIKKEKRARAIADAKDAKVRAFENFLGMLGKIVPDYAELARHPMWNTWAVENIDSFSGRTIKEVFQDAEGRGDVRTAAFYLNEFRKLVKQSSKLDEEITPESRGGGGTPTKRPVDTISMKEINIFYDNYARGVYKNNKKKADEIEAYIDKAISEGRVTP